MRHPAQPLDNNPIPDSPGRDTQHEALQAAESPALHDAELWARRALGADHGPGHDDRPSHRQPAPPHLGGGNGRPNPMRRRFARDGDVTVVVAQPGIGVGTAHRASATAVPPVNRLANAEAALAAEQAARQRADRALAEAQSAIKRLQTQLAHAEMTGREAIEAAQRAEGDRQALTVALEAERAARLAAEEALRGTLNQSPARPRSPARVLADAGEATPGKRPRGRPRRVPGQAPPKRQPNQKPVKWW